MKKVIVLKIIFISVLGLLRVPTLKAQTPDWQWAKSAGGNNLDYSNGTAVDGNGNCYITGSFRSEKIAFGTDTLINSNKGFPENFVVKYNTSGKVVWAKSAGGNYSEFTTCVAADVNGNCYVTGSFSGIKVVLGTDTFVNANWGYADIFVAKYDAFGNVLWAKSVGGNSDDLGSSIAVDGNSNCYITGCLNGNFFIKKYDTFGKLTWETSVSASSSIYGKGIALDDSRNIYVTGTGSGNITFGTYTISYSQFIVKYDSSGNVLWAKSVYGSSFNDDWNIDIDKYGNCYVAGEFVSSTMTFGSITLSNYNNGTRELFLAKYDKYGNVLWAKATKGIEGLQDHFVYSIASGDNGSIYLTGSFNGSGIIFGTDTLTCTPYYGNVHIFIAKYDSSGKVLWCKTGENFIGRGKGIAVDGNDNCYVSGNFTSSKITFGADTLTNALGGDPDIFVAKLGSIITSKLENFENRNSISISPNPSNGEFVIYGLQEVTGLVEVYDLMGRVLYTGLLNLLQTQTSIQGGILISLKSPPGIYFVKVSNGKTVSLKKLIVQ